MITVLIPTYRRVDDLLRCLEGIRAQTRMPDEVLVIVRYNDHDTLEALIKLDYHDLSLRVITVAVPGQVAALNRGLTESRGDIIAITDDDTIPKKDWLQRIESHFLSDPAVGGVGGRDWVHEGSRILSESRPVVGKIQWFGRVIGNHHLGVGPAREVDLLKGANMSYRRAAIRGKWFEEKLRGSGAQVHNDLAFSYSVKRSGWKLIYDPLVAVDHYPAQRHDSDKRNQYNAVSHFNMVYNETVTLSRHMGLLRRIIFLAWSILIGTASSPGLVQWARLAVKPHSHAGRKVAVVWKGRIIGFYHGLKIDPGSG
ncbi:glycosyltransferase family 2 protein [Gorillibacterium massiliense]|uniref:glycosyltransferase family 2 protein n=1 Tax=Gorillibacterium massiliense TaxID=1280390 RepID=UPI0004AF0B8B|nr:glycosyltransferase family 2 protein [Gorillibacterium massiliense]